MKQKKKPTRALRPTVPPPIATAINCKDSLKAEEVYKGILASLQANVGELNIVVEVSGKQHFTSCSITNIFDMLREYAEKLAEEFNKEIGVTTDAN